MEMVPIVAIVMSHLTVIVLASIYLSTRHKERMALLEYGRDASVFHPERKARKGTLKWGLVLGFCGLGLFLGGLFSGMGMNEETAYFSMIFIGAGAGLLLFYRLTARDGNDVL